VDAHDQKVAALAERAEKLGDVADVQALAAAARSEQDELKAAVDALQRKVCRDDGPGRRAPPAFWLTTASRCVSRTALPQLDDGLVALRFSEDHREAARWLKEKRDAVAALPAPTDAATAEGQAKKLANLVRGCSARH